MCRNRPCSSCQRRNGKSSCVTGWISNRQNRVDNSCGHNGHAHNLRGAGGSADHSICQIFSIQGQHQLTGFIHTYFKQDLVGANLRQIERIRSGSGNIRSAVWPILRETDISSRGYRCCVVGRHQCIKVCIIQHAAGRSNLTCRPLGADGTLGTNGTNGTLRTGRTAYTITVAGTSIFARIFFAAAVTRTIIIVAISLTIISVIVLVAVIIVIKIPSAHDNHLFKAMYCIV